MPLTPDVRRSIDQIRPCKGPAAALQDLIGGSVHCGFLATPTTVAHVKRGKLIGLAVTAAGRSPVAMKLPTMSEAGSAGFEASFGQLPLAPKGIPPAVVAALNETFSAALARADAREDAGDGPGVHPRHARGGRRGRDNGYSAHVWAAAH